MGCHGRAERSQRRRRPRRPRTSYAEASRFSARFRDRAGAPSAMPASWSATLPSRGSVQRVVSAATRELLAGPARAGVVAPDLFGRTTVVSTFVGLTRCCASMRSEVAIDVDKPGVVLPSGLLHRHATDPPFSKSSTALKFARARRRSPCALRRMRRAMMSSISECERPARRATTRRGRDDRCMPRSSGYPVIEEIHRALATSRRLR
jgi:hypothetical protein